MEARDGDDALVANHLGRIMGCFYVLQEPLEWHGVFFAVGIKARNCLELALRQVFSHFRFGALVLAPQIGAADAEIQPGRRALFSKNDPTSKRLACLSSSRWQRSSAAGRASSPCTRGTCEAEPTCRGTLGR